MIQNAPRRLAPPVVHLEYPVPESLFGHSVLLVPRGHIYSDARTFGGLEGGFIFSAQNYRERG